MLENEKEIVDKSAALIRGIKKQGFLSKEDIENVFLYLNKINGTNEVVTFCTPCVEEKLKSLINWTKPRLPV